MKLPLTEKERELLIEALQERLDALHDEFIDWKNEDEYWAHSERVTRLFNKVHNLDGEPVRRDHRGY